MVNYIYLSEFQLDNAKVSHTEASFWIYNYLYPMVLLRLKCLINEMNYILILWLIVFGCF